MYEPGIGMGMVWFIDFEQFYMSAYKGMHMFVESVINMCQCVFVQSN
jgi:hypothetical protein